MLQASIVLFVLAALGGVYLAAQHYKLRPVGVPFALGHGVLGAAALVLMVAALLKSGSFEGLAIFSTVLFVAAAFGGFVLFALHLKGKALPFPMIVGHGLTAALALVLLLVHIYAR